LISTIYIEDEIRDHERTREICERFSHATQIPCDRYTSVFNSNSQNFRLQKKQPSLILAKKHKTRVLETPAGYGIGSENNYYFSHMMNCLYDCRYCFLQGMYRSAHYVVFVNYEDFFADIIDTAKINPGESWFFSGYDCDSLAMEPVTGFIDACLEHFATTQKAHLEIRTKSTQIRTLLDRPAMQNSVVAYSFTPEDTARGLEHKVPSVSKRIAALAKLQQHGWQVGLRLDPLIITAQFVAQYRTLLDQIFASVNAGQIHSVSYGAFRLPKPFFKKMVTLYPAERLFATSLTESDSMVSYSPSAEQECLEQIRAMLLEHVPENVLYPCS
jgi:spore photoproduct lyase